MFVLNFQLVRQQVTAKPWPQQQQWYQLRLAIYPVLRLNNLLPNNNNRRQFVLPRNPLVIMWPLPHTAKCLVDNTNNSLSNNSNSSKIPIKCRLQRRRNRLRKPLTVIQRRLPKVIVMVKDLARRIGCCDIRIKRRRISNRPRTIKSITIQVGKEMCINFYEHVYIKFVLNATIRRDSTTSAAKPSIAKSSLNFRVC